MTTHKFEIDTNKHRDDVINLFLFAKKNDDIEHAVSLNPFTHIYMFDVGFPCELHYSLANKFNCSLYAIYLISYQPPKFIIDEFGFKVLLMHQFSTRMNGTYKY